MNTFTNKEIKKESYFSNRNVFDEVSASYKFPRYLLPYFQNKDKSLNVLDIGCGLGQMLLNLKNRGFNNLRGIDINNESISACRSKGLYVEKIEDIRDYARKSNLKFDRIIMSHVLEHLEKDSIIETLACIKKYLLSKNGLFFLMVPNAQSPTGVYWRYEDFTHTILFTAGSCQYVLQAAGFSNITFLDPDGTKHMNPLKKMPIKLMILLYKLNEKLWQKILQTSYHKPSPNIYTFDIKVKAM